jgi:hypothetical protein
MRFTSEQYEVAIQDLQSGRHQLEPDGRNCTICGDSGHQAWECGRNPLLAIAMCRQIADNASVLHDTLHSLSGYDFRFGVQQGPAAIVEKP